MKKITAVSTAALAAVALSVALVGCGSKTETKTSSSTSTSTSTSTATSTSTKAESTSPTEAAGPNKTIQDYLKENQITETQVKMGEPGAPKIDLPTPTDWSVAKQPPDWAYGAIIYDKAEVPDDPPSIIAIVSKLTGNVDPAKILEFAPGELKNLPGWEPLGDGSKSTLSGFDAFQMGGNYTRDGKKRIIAQKTVVIPGEDGVYVLQMNADALDGQEGPLMDATGIIDEKTTITP